MTPLASSLRSHARIPRTALLPTKYLVDCAVRERHDEEISVGSSLNVGHHTEIATKQQALALDDGVGVRHGVARRRLVEVVGHAISQSWIIHGDLSTVAGEIEAPQEPPFEE